MKKPLSRRGGRLFRAWSGMAATAQRLLNRPLGNPFAERQNHEQHSRPRLAGQAELPALGELPHQDAMRNSTAGIKLL